MEHVGFPRSRAPDGDSYVRVLLKDGSQKRPVGDGGKQDRAGDGHPSVWVQLKPQGG